MKKYSQQLAKLLLLVIVVSVLYLTDSCVLFLLSEWKTIFLCSGCHQHAPALHYSKPWRGCTVFPEPFFLSTLLVWIHKNNSQKRKKNLILRRINTLVRLMQRGGEMAVCSAGEVGPFPAFFSTIWRRKRKKNHVFFIPNVDRKCWEILVTRQLHFGEFCLGFLLVYCDNNLGSFGSCPCGRGGFLELWKCASPV